MWSSGIRPIRSALGEGLDDLDKESFPKPKALNLAANPGEGLRCRGLRCSWSAD